MTTSIHVYESNGGQLYLIEPSAGALRGWAGLEHAEPGSAAVLCEAIALDDIAPEGCDELTADECREIIAVAERGMGGAVRVATWTQDGASIHVDLDVLGHAARAFLGLVGITAHVTEVEARARKWVIEEYVPECRVDGRDPEDHPPWEYDHGDNTTAFASAVLSSAWAARACDEALRDALEQRAAALARADALGWRIIMAGVPVQSGFLCAAAAAGGHEEVRAYLRRERPQAALYPIGEITCVDAATVRFADGLPVFEDQLREVLRSS